MLILSKLTAMHRFTGRGLAGFSLLVFLSFSGFFTSCVATRKAIYFTDVPDSASAAKPLVITATKYTDPIILSNDILAITVQSIAQNETNTPITSSTIALFNPLNGFLVDKNGNIEMSLVGFVHVGGLTTTEARELIKEKAKEYYKEPVVNVRIANFDIQIIGEINHPGSSTFPSEKVNILEAIASAGDIQLTAKKDNILLIRTEGDDKKFIRFSLNSSAIFQSPYFYLRQRDILYIEPTKFKVQNSDNKVTRNIGIITAFLSLIALFLSFRTK